MNTSNKNNSNNNKDHNENKDDQKEEKLKTEGNLGEWIYIDENKKESVISLNDFDLNEWEFI